ncbi:MAG: dynamin family protein [Candidatus Accumulibacter sp.]|uniref:dynamin family protein n=1 Tax=Accumulibacter sp. TaxID=2053492 RepID=UPI001A4A5DB3|nr:dynamin family protein [Accumulibacter sp.]MBL8408911.1 dynamin family protein [Accumulibacter sp.]
MNVHTELRERFAAWISRFVQVTDQIGGNRIESYLRDDLDKALSDPRIRIVVCGECNTGKSTLINGLVGKPGLVPADVVSGCPYITVVERADSEAYEVLRHGSTAPLGRQDFLDLAANGETDSTIDSIRIKADLLWPTEPAIIVDTPGIDNLTKTRSEVTVSFLPQADVIVLVMSIITGINESVLDFVRNHLSAHAQRRLIFVLNQKDHLKTDGDVSRRLASCQAVLRHELPNAPWLATNAELAARSNGEQSDLDSGIADLRDAIVRLVQRERCAILGQRFIRQAGIRIDEVKSRLLAEEAQLSLPLVEAQKDMAEFRKLVGETSRRNADAFQRARGLVATEIERWLRERLPVLIRITEDKSLAYVQELDDLEVLRQYMNIDKLAVMLEQELRVLQDDLNTVLRESISRAGSEVLSEQNALSHSVKLAVVASSPTIESWFREVPVLFVKLLDFLLADLLSPNSRLLLLLSRWPRVETVVTLVKELEFLHAVTPIELVRRELQDAIRKSLSAYRADIEPRLRSAAEAATQDIFGQVRYLLDRHLGAVEDGLDAARAKLAEGRGRVEARRALLAAARLDIERLSQELASLAG